ncbi:hypothetical protein C0Q70_01027 [Pomacea canaliculata]|uniref:Receptor ligand binding region domain-containing protein n=1 Tax=Pomacea canaliculata TaxID=400727 RepID=A0A2T7PYA8_POMCA|nr:hypothetical protein C0Q70_01027 [Pomacea canaliculata]
MAVYWLESAYVSSKTNKKQVIKLGYITGSASPNFTGSYYPKNGYYNRPGTLISGALTFALEQVNRNSSVLPNHTLEFIIAETYGQEGESIKADGAAAQQGNSGLHRAAGDLCARGSDSCCLQFADDLLRK